MQGAACACHCVLAKRVCGHSHACAHRDVSGVAGPGALNDTAPYLPPDNGPDHRETSPHSAFAPTRKRLQQQQQQQQQSQGRGAGGLEGGDEEDASFAGSDRVLAECVEPVQGLGAAAVGLADGEGPKENGGGAACAAEAQACADKGCLFAILGPSGAGALRAGPGHSGACRGIQGRSGSVRGIQGHSGAFRGMLRTFRGIQEHSGAGACSGPLGASVLRVGL